MKKRRFISALLTYLFVISVLPIDFFVDKVKAAEMSNNQTDYELSESYIYDSAVQEDLAILSKENGIYTNKDGQMEIRNKGKYTFGFYIGKSKEYAYFKNWDDTIEFNLSTGNYKILNLPISKRKTYIENAIVDKQGNKWLQMLDESNFNEPQRYIVRLTQDGTKCERLKLEGTTSYVYGLKCDTQNNIWFQSGLKNEVIGKISFNENKNEFSFKTFQISSQSELLSKFEVNKEGDLFISSYKDGRIWEVLKYKQSNGKMIFDRIVDDKTASFSADNNGELWFLTKGDTSTSNYKVCKLETNGLNKKYDVSNLMNSLKVYNESNMILTGKKRSDSYNGTSGDVYKAIGKNKIVNDNKVIINSKVGWVLEGEKWYYYTDNVTVKNEWRKLGNIWYYFDNDGAMATGWRLLGGKWYYLGDGAMRTGWVLVGGKWYYLYSNGDMASNTTIGGYRLGSSGAWIH